MPRDPTYHDVEKMRRHALKPYDRHAGNNQVAIGDDDNSDVEAASDDEGSGGDDDAGSAEVSSDDEEASSAESSSDDDEDATNDEHDNEVEVANSDQNSDSEEEASDVEDAIDDEDQAMEKPTNIFNPSGSRNNCTDMGGSYASALPNEYSPPASDSGGRDLDIWKERLEENGFKTSNNPPDEEYLSGAREASVAYWHANGDGHVVAMDGGDNDATYTYSDHQIRVDEDITEEVNEARRDGRVAFYVTKPTFEDREREQQQEDDYEEDNEEEEGGDEDHGDDGDYEMDNGWNKYR